jgi:pimeloyl-ACP methyl ester carboxylesterase
MPKETIGNIKMNYEVKGTGEPVVLITGLGGDISFWRGMVPLLSGRFKVITFDIRGTGLTESPDGPFDVGILAGDVIKLLDHLSMPKAHVIGWSMGGNVAQEIALSYSERVASLTLVSTYMKRPARSSRIMNVMVESVRSGGDLKYLFEVMQLLCTTQEAYRAMEEKGTFVPWKLSSTVEQFYYQLAAVDGFDSRITAKNISAPTLVIHGNRDIMVPMHMGMELAAQIKGADFYQVDGFGHTIPPKEYAKAFIDHALRNPIV